MERDMTSQPPRRRRSARSNREPDASVADGQVEESPHLTRARLTRKGQETRATIMKTALALFAERGFHTTTVPDIVAAAGIGHGTFYEYFSNKRDVLLGLSHEMRLDHARVRARTAHPATLAERIRMDLMWWLSDFVESIELSKVWDEGETFDPDVRDARNKLRDVQLARIRHGIELAAPQGVDPAIAAEALLAMTEEFAQRWFVEGRGSGTGAGEVLAAAETLANLWIGAVHAQGVILPAEPDPAEKKASEQESRS